VRCGILQTCAGRCKALRSRLTGSEQGQGDRKARPPKRALPTSRYFSSSRLYVFRCFAESAPKAVPLDRPEGITATLVALLINILTANARPCLRAHQTGAPHATPAPQHSALCTLRRQTHSWREGTLLHILQSGERSQLVRARPAAEAEHCAESAPEVAASRAMEARHRRGRQRYRGDRH